MTEHATTEVSMRPRGATLTRTAVTTLVLVALSLNSACDGDGAIRAELAAQQASWERQLQTLRSEHALLEQRFVQDFETRGSLPVARRPERARVRATIDGVRQSLSDVKNQARQAGEAVTAALSKGTQQGQRALENERIAMTTSVEAISRDMASAVRAVDQLVNEDGRAAVASEGGERR